GGGYGSTFVLLVVLLILLIIVGASFYNLNANALERFK
ncbi:YjcZ family sporulation protein, partial [Bacillus sp. S20C3]|nr:YjcZ family sporulation protein [Bacillus sp. S20C3]